MTYVDANGNSSTPNVVEGGQDGDDHAWIIVYDDVEAVGVDIPPHVYEIGGGYNWRKIPDVRIKPSDVDIFPIKRSDISADR